MRSLHEPDYRASLESRVRTLTPASSRQWGTMSTDQMLWHINAGLGLALGEVTAPREKSPLPKPIMKFIVLNLPWPKGAPTSEVFRAAGPYDFETERARCLQLIKRVSERPLGQLGTEHFFFGRMSGRDVSRLQAKHLDHHLKQFGV